MSSAVVVRGRASSCEVLPFDVELMGQRINVGDITGRQGVARVSHLSRDALAWSMFHEAIDGHDGALDVLDGLAIAERRRGSRPLVARAAEFDSPAWETDCDVVGGDWSECVLDAESAQRLALERTTEGRILILAGGAGWDAGCERVRTGAERHSVSRVPRGGIAGSVARYTMRRFGGRLSDVVLSDAAAAAVAAMWCHWAGTYAGVVAGVDAIDGVNASLGCCEGGGGDMSSDSGVIRALWRIGWRAARREVVAESRRGTTGRGADRLLKFTVFDGSKPCESWRPCGAGAIVRRGASLSDLQSLAAFFESGGAAITGAEPVELAEFQPMGCEEWRGVPLRDAVRWLAGCLVAPISGLCLPGGLRRGVIGGRGGLAARQQVRGLAWLLAAGARHGKVRGDALWDRAAKFAGFDSGDALRLSLSRGKVWHKLRVAALSRSSEAERWLAARVRACASVVRVARDAAERVPVFKRGTVRNVPSLTAWRVAVAQAVNAGRLVRGQGFDRSTVRRASSLKRGALRAVKLALSSPLPLVKRSIGRRISFDGSAVESLMLARGARARAVRALRVARGSRASHWAAVASGVWAGQRARKGRVAVA